VATIIQTGEYEVGDGVLYGTDIDRALRNLAKEVELLETQARKANPITDKALYAAFSAGYLVKLHDALSMLRGYVTAQCGMDREDDADESSPERQPLND
jgi:hypothetical protein